MPNQHDLRRPKSRQASPQARHQILTPFQRRVYAVVKRIPKGRVHSYQWVAQQLGDPQLARAVGQALKRNPDPAPIPCHRVIRSDGSLGGYAWGLPKKRRLLDQERQHTHQTAARSR